MARTLRARFWILLAVELPRGVHRVAEIRPGCPSLSVGRRFGAAQPCHLGWLGALAFTTAASTAWEYGFEANGVRPSAQDLVYTPLAGLVLGEGRFQLVKGLHHRQGGLADVLRWVVDPFGELERAAGSPC